MAKTALAMCAVLAIVALGVNAASATKGTPDSGVRGLVLYGPTCPVQRPGETCERPYQASLTFRRMASRLVVARVHTNDGGHFTVRLRAGSYLLEASNAARYPRAQSEVVSVTAHHFTRLTIHFDSGIR